MFIFFFLVSDPPFVEDDASIYDSSTTISTSIATENTSITTVQTTEKIKETTTLTYDGDISEHEEKEIEEKESTTLTYVGDVESVEDHVKNKKMQKNSDLCQGNFDTVASIRGEVFIFKGELMWRFAKQGQIRRAYPAPFKQMFIGLPEDVKNVDAVYERPTDNNILFFTGMAHNNFH